MNTLEIVLFFAAMFLSGFLAGVIDGELRKRDCRRRIASLQKELDESIARFVRISQALIKLETMRQKLDEISKIK